MNRPDDFIERLAAVVESARRAPFWRQRLGDRAIASLRDFDSMPITTAREYRKQRFGDLITSPRDIIWVPGPWLGPSANRAPVAEDTADAQARTGAMQDALTHALPESSQSDSALVVSIDKTRLFGAEMCAILIRMGIPAHLVADTGTSQLKEFVNRVEPSILAALSPRIYMSDLPSSVRGVVTVNRRQRRMRLPNGIAGVDLFVQNELGVIGFTVGDGALQLDLGRFYMERSSYGTLIATPYASRIQPIVRLDTGESVESESLEPLALESQPLADTARCR